MRYCPAFNSIAIRTKKDENEEYLLSRTRCKSWSCAFCSEKNRSRWRAFLLDALPAISEEWSFHTVTLPSWIRENREFSDEDRTLASLALIRGNWEKLMKRIKRYCGENIQYFRVFEKHFDGTLHIHFLLSMHVQELKTANRGTVKEYGYWKWLKDNAAECGFGYISSSENLDEPKKAVGYTTKYMTKEDYFIEDMIKKYRIRRFQASQGIGSCNEWGRDEVKWENRSFVDKHEINTKPLKDTSKSRLLSERDADKNGMYPPLSEYKASDEYRKARKKLSDS